MLAALVFSVVTTISSLSLASADADAELRRGALFGAKVNSVSDEVRDQLKLGEGTGAVIDAVIPGSSTGAAGFKPGDVLLTFDGVKIAGAAEIIQKIAARKAGASATIEFRRDGALRKVAFTLKARPLEKSDVFEILYGSVPSRAGRLRHDPDAS